MTNKNSSWNTKPLLLTPTGKDYLWGGQRINTEFEKNIDLFPLAETWECSTHPDGPSFCNGKSLIDIIKKNPEMLGTRHQGASELPIIIKFIDAKNDLSVQVHPSDEYAMKKENGQLGKTEMWYVLDAANDAKIIYGLKRHCDTKEIRQAIENGNLMDYLQVVPVKKNDLFFIEPGTIHAICAGVLIAEIQESSNLTYRLYDYNRVGKDGIKRELHIKKALDVVNLNSYVEPKQPLRVLKYKAGVASELLCRCKYFEVYRMIVNTEKRKIVYYNSDDTTFRVLLCINGCGIIKYNGGQIEFYKGDCIFVPASSDVLIIHGNAKFLEVRG